MSDQEYLKVFSENLKYYLTKYDISQAELAKRLGVTPTSVSNWATGQKTPRMDKVDAMCEIFNCKRSDLLEGKDDVEDGYYLDPETAKKAQELFDNPKMRLLFDAARDSRPEDLQIAADLLYRLKANTLGLDNDEGC